MLVMCVCVCGWVYWKFVYYFDCLKYLMKCVGKCGEGKFECIFWDEVIIFIVEWLKMIM